MDLFEAIRSRRTIYKFEDRAVPDDALSRALEAACWAPNHKRTEPWRFVVVGPETRARLGAVAARLAVAKAGDVPDDERARQVQRATAKLTDLPCLVVMTTVKNPGDPLREKEDYAACACAAQNLQLSLWAEGIGCQWGTGGPTRDDESYDILGIDRSTEEIIGFFKVGYPKDVPSIDRRPHSEVTKHLP
ncbi:MAG: nitroreductase family protein [Myxococcota bacterium]